MLVSLKHRSTVLLKAQVHACRRAMQHWPGFILCNNDIGLNKSTSSLIQVGFQQLLQGYLILIEKN